MTELAIRGGTIVTPAGQRRADLGIAEGRVVEVADTVEGRREIDASGLLILPGMVDTHVHLMDPGPTEREDFPTGTRAAAARGATTIVEHTHAHPVRSADDLAEKISYLADRANVDYALAAHLWPEDIPTMSSTWEAGVAFFKLFTCTTHGVPGLDPARLHAAFESLAAIGGRALVHCEDESLTEVAERTLRDQGRFDPGVLVEWRSREAEEVAVAGAGVLAAATGATVTLAHISTPAVAELVGYMRQRGADIAAEACPQYFALDEREVEEHGPFRKFTPPARIRGEDEREAMWEAVRQGAFHHFSTDHAPSTAEQKRAGDIWSAPFGLPGLDTTFPFLIDAALSGKLPLPEMVRLTSAAPAARYGLAPRKGSLDPGADADFVLVDPAGRWVVEDSEIISKAGWSPYSGRTFRGRIEATYLRGRLIAEGGKPLDERQGRFIPGLGAKR
ncbi:MAG TPA: dihydroorotase family protein [Acidimicrobiia bacterium]|jgi:allantoinase|nr:dihydroorotase family protein [Acidimicrobiia bacterium]